MKLESGLENGDVNTAIPNSDLNENRELDSNANVRGSCTQKVSDKRGETDEFFFFFLI